MSTALEANIGAPNDLTDTKKRSFNEGKRQFKKNKKVKVVSDWPEGTHDEVLLNDVRNLLSRLDLAKKSSEESHDTEAALPEKFTEVDLDIVELSSTGDGLGVLPGSSRVVVVPFTVPGDRVTAKLIRHDPHEPITSADFVRVLQPSERRDDTRVKCQYFAKCSGCQFQMMERPDQLRHKKTIIERAYKHFSKLPASSVPSVSETQHGEREYGYRTKLTPHFDAPPQPRKDRRKGIQVTWEKVPPIGFMQKGTRRTIDIEDCPIGTAAVRRGIQSERERVTASIHSYKRGATLLCREHTTPLPSSPAPADDAIVENGYLRTCTTDPKAVTTEYIAGQRFDNPAGAFFQNNNDILPPFLARVKSLVAGPDPITHLVDAYCGSGLFTVALSSLFQKSIGIDVSAQSIEFATKNAQLNDIPADRASFVAGDAKDIFAHVRGFPADETAVVIDPSRKGCDMPFLSQLMAFRPRRVVYVSCNVHTQARDVGVLCAPETGPYELESVEGWDFFPQTAHVEGLAVLKRRD